MENGKNLIHSWNINEKGEGNYQGLTKREYFAGLAMQGLLSNPNINRPLTGEDDKHARFSEVCIQYADSLLKQLEQ